MERFQYDEQIERLPLCAKIKEAVKIGTDHFLNGRCAPMKIEPVARQQREVLRGLSAFHPRAGIEAESFNAPNQFCHKGFVRVHFPT